MRDERVIKRRKRLFAEVVSSSAQARCKAPSPKNMYIV